MGFRIGRARAQHAYPEPPNVAAAAVLLAHGWNDNGQTVVTVAAGTAATVAFVTVTPKVTGKFQIYCTAVVQNANRTAGVHTAQAQIGRGIVVLGAAPLVVDYTEGSAVALEPGTAGNDNSVQVAVTFENTVPLVVGSAVQFDFALIGDAGAGTNLTVQSHSAQIAVQELPN